MDGLSEVSNSIEVYLRMGVYVSSVPLLAGFYWLVFTG